MTWGLVNSDFIGKLNWTCKKTEAKQYFSLFIIRVHIFKMIVQIILTFTSLSTKKGIFGSDFLRYHLLLSTSLVSNRLGVKQIYQNREKSTKRLDDVFSLIPFPPFFLFLGDQKIESETKTKQSHVLSSVACNNNTTPLVTITQQQLKKHMT